MVLLTSLTKAEQVWVRPCYMRDNPSYQGHQGRPLSSWANMIPRLISIMRIPLKKNKTRLATGNVLAVMSASFLPNLESRSSEGFPELLKVTYSSNI